MAALLREGLEQGAFGYSTGLEYPVERAVNEDEIVELCAVVAKAEALYATHTRDRDAAADEGSRKLRTAERAGSGSRSPTCCRGRRGTGRTSGAVEVIDAAKSRGLDLAFDQHTRLYGTTYLTPSCRPGRMTAGALVSSAI